MAASPLEELVGLEMYSEVIFLITTKFKKMHVQSLDKYMSPVMQLKIAPV